MFIFPLLIAATLLTSSPSPTSATGESTSEEEDAGRRSAEKTSEPTAGSSSVDEPVWTVPMAHGAAVMLGMRASLFALWPTYFPLWPTAETGRNIQRAYTLPPEYDPHRRLLESDGDPLLLNTVGHGAFGSEVYQRARACRHGPMQAFVFTALTSAVWEYGLEAPHKRPSAVDLIWTPVVGAAFGELRFQMWRLARGDPSGPRPPARRALMILFDPFGEAERALGTHC